tara:strand:- start:42 stop:284 length:243 start_codon:yes stop_codon:yes gene_type:complete
MNNRYVAIEVGCLECSEMGDCEATVVGRFVDFTEASAWANERSESGGRGGDTFVVDLLDGGNVVAQRGDRGEWIEREAKR